jgi:N-acetylmuramoyl-L-alanine amidase
MTKVAIDAGHGSYTAGKRTPDGYREHYANVVVANYLYDILKANPSNFDIIRTGWDDENYKDDEDTSLKKRQTTIKNNNCSISISIHFNASGDGKSYNNASGIETFYHTTNYSDSKKLAECVQNELIKGTSQKNRGVKQGALAMCNCSSMGTKASILCELGFMTNLTEATLMQDKEFCKECAREIAQGLANYLNIDITLDTNTNTNTNDKEAIKTDIEEQHPMELEQFIEYVGSIAVADYQNHKILPSITIAQAIKESARGTSELAVGKYPEVNGYWSGANALFGIKKNGWTGKTYIKVSTEQNADGSYRQEDAEWRAYDSWKDSIIDHNEYLATRRVGNQSQNNFQNLIGETNLDKAIGALVGNSDKALKEKVLVACQNDIGLYNAVKGSTTTYSYATSITYAWSLKHDYIEKYDLTRFDKIALEGGQIEPSVQPQIPTDVDQNEQFYYVTVGYYRSLANAQNFANQLRSKGILTTIQKGRLEQQ